MDILMDDLTGDVVFDNGIAVTQTTTEDLAQRLKIRLSTFQGEWFLDTTFGVPWFQQVLGRQRSKAAVDSIIQEQVFLEPDVDSILEYISEWNVRTKHFDVSMKIRAIDFTVFQLTNTDSTSGFNFTVV